MKLNARMFALAVILSAAPAIAQDAKIIEAAKKEGGKVVIYGSLESQVVDDVLAGFRKKTGLNAEYRRASAMSVMKTGIHFGFGLSARRLDSGLRRRDGNRPKLPVDTFS